MVQRLYYCLSNNSIYQTIIMSTMTNAMRPTNKPAVKSSPAYAAFKLMGSCTKCGDRSHQTVNIGHPIFKLVCPTCRAYLTEIKQRAIERNKEVRLAAYADKNSSVTEVKTP